MSSEENLVTTNVARPTRFKPVPFALLSLVIVFFLFQVVGGGITELIFGPNPKANQALGFRLASMIAELLFVLAPALLLMRVQSGNWKSILGINKADWRSILLSMVGIIALQEILEVYTYFQGMIPLPNSVKEFIDSYQNAIDQLYKLLIVAHSLGDFLVVTAVVAITPAICEEFLFRGLVQGNFQIVMRKWPAIVMTGIIFGAYHVQPVTFVGLCSLGIYLGYLMYTAKSILVPIAAHFTNNFFTILVFYLSGRDSLVAPDDAQSVSPLAIVILLTLSIVVFILTIRFMRSRDLEPKEVEDA